MAFTSLTPGAMLCPVPAVMVSCASEKDRPNIITIAWAGTVCSQPPMVSVAVRKERFSHHIMTDSGEFVVNLVGEGQLRAMDYCGVRSGREEDKFAACQLTPAKVPELLYAPAIAECPLYLACRTEQVQGKKHFLCTALPPTGHRASVLHTPAAPLALLSEAVGAVPASQALSVLMTCSCKHDRHRSFVQNGLEQ